MTNDYNSISFVQNDYKTKPPGGTTSPQPSTAVDQTPQTDSKSDPSPTGPRYFGTTSPAGN